MWKMNNKTKLYLLIAFTWTWFGWIAAYVISYLSNEVLVIDGTIFTLFTSGPINKTIMIQLLFMIAVYGPFVGFMMTNGFSNLIKKKNSLKHLWLYIVLIPLVSILPGFLLSVITSLDSITDLKFIIILTTIMTYFVSNLLTSGTEEFGWRGVLYPEMKATGMSFWDISFKGGIIWALWHYPLLVIMYLPFGLMVLLPSLVGFTASIIAMNYITNFIYERSSNIWAVVILHALNNTMSFTLVLLFPKTPFTILSSLLAWVIVWWIEKKYPKIIL